MKFIIHHRGVDGTLMVVLKAVVCSYVELNCRMLYSVSNVYKNLRDKYDKLNLLDCLLVYIGCSLSVYLIIW